MICLQNLCRIKGNKILLDVKYLISFYKNYISTSKCFGISETQYLCSSFKAPSSVQAKDRLYGKDDIPENFDLIYRAPLGTYCKIAHPVGLISSVFVPGFVYFNLNFSTQELYNDELGPLILAQDWSDLFGFTLGSFLVGVGIISFILKYPLRIFHNPSTGEYISVSSSVVPFKTKKMYFTSASKVVPKKLSLNLFKDSLYQLGSRKVFLIDEYFKTPYDLELMLKSG